MLNIIVNRCFAHDLSDQWFFVSLRGGCRVGQGRPGLEQQVPAQRVVDVAVIILELCAAVVRGVVEMSSCCGCLYSLLELDLVFETWGCST